jgi:probable phosphoglycerate mutase
MNERMRIHHAVIFSAAILLGVGCAHYPENARMKHYDPAEWNYGKYEGLRTVEIHAKRPDWQLFRDGCPSGELPDQVGARADHVVSRVRAIKGDVFMFSSGHFLRVLAARWLGLEPAAGRFFILATASVSVLGYENSLSLPVIRWNDTRHVGN